MAKSYQQQIYQADGKKAARIKRLLITAIRFNAKLRWRIELMCPATLLDTSARLIGAHPESTPRQRAWAEPVRKQLKEAATLPLEGLSAAEHNRAAQLAEDACNYAFGVAAEHKPRNAMWIGLATLFWVEKMLDVDPGLLIENSPLHHAVHSLLEFLKEDPELLGTMERSAQRGAERLGRAWNEIELYRDGEGLFERRKAAAVQREAA